MKPSTYAVNNTPQTLLHTKSTAPGFYLSRPSGLNIGGGMKFSEVVNEIAKERERQDDEFLESNSALWHSGIRHVLGEEVGEIDKAFNERHLRDYKAATNPNLDEAELDFANKDSEFEFMISLKKELIDAGATIFQWLERFDWPEG